jgi:hypothetical protein
VIESLAVDPHVDPGRAIELVELGGRAGFTTMDPDDLARFAPIEGLDVPEGRYMLRDVDTGQDLLDVAPDAALEAIRASGRSPLTLAEGLALVACFPKLLRDANCFSLLGSRCGDRRVTALWLSKGRPRLGWCWAGSPHSWLGSASCAGRFTDQVRRVEGSVARDPRRPTQTRIA